MPTDGLNVTAATMATTDDLVYRWRDLTLNADRLITYDEAPWYQVRYDEEVVNVARAFNGDDMMRFADRLAEIPLMTFTYNTGDTRATAIITDDETYSDELKDQEIAEQDFRELIGK